MDHNFHIPGRPKSPEPQSLVRLASSLQHPKVNKVGITTTTDGLWALLVVVQSGVKVPIKEVEEKCKNYPVIYQQDANREIVARPAYPDAGE